MGKSSRYPAKKVKGRREFHPPSRKGGEEEKKEERGGFSVVHQGRIRTASFGVKTESEGRSPLIEGGEEKEKGPQEKIVSSGN